MPDRPRRTHIVLIDGTFSRLEPGRETNIGLIYRLLDEVGQTTKQTVSYDPGVQGGGFRKWVQGALGVGLNDAIARCYGMLASRYAPGDQIVLLGYSRGAYAVRSLAGWIGRVGLLKAHHATQRRVARSFRHYERLRLSPSGAAFSEKFCHQGVPIEMIGVFETVKALGLPYPVLSRIAPMATQFHDHSLSADICNACQALALDETRTAFSPVRWEPGANWPGRLQQVWFSGVHADIGGQVRGNVKARGLSNIPLIWMLENLERCGIDLPADWSERFTTDPAAPSVGGWRGMSKFFVMRANRLVPSLPYESMHPSVSARCLEKPRYRPKAEVSGLETATRLGGRGPRARVEEV